MPPGTIIDKYKIIELISEGGMGQVYKAERADGQFTHIVAIKCLSAPLSNKDFMLKFRQEQQILANLQHRTIASLYDGGITETGIPYIIMEYIDGLPFDQYVKDNDLTENRIIQLLIDVCYAVQSAHNQFVLHQDIKPNNILINANGDAKLLDFGVARIISEINRQREFHKAQRLMSQNHPVTQVNGPESATTVSTATFLAKIYRENSKPEKADSLTLKYQLEQN